MRLRRSVTSVGATLRPLSMWYTRCAPHSSLYEARSNYIYLPRFFAFELSPSTGQALDLPDLPPQLRAKCLSALCRISGRLVLLPRSVQIPPCYNRWDSPLYHGGFADVWKGEYQGLHVAVKVLRVYRTSDLGKIASVSSHSLAKSLH